MERVLIAFQADTEPVEQLALAASVAAVESGGSIRLRRLAAPDSPELGHRGYGRLQPADLEWAELLLIVLESPAINTAGTEDLLVALRGAKTEPGAGKTAAVFGPQMAEAKLQDYWRYVLHHAGFKTVVLHEAELGPAELERVRQATKALFSL